MGNPAPDFQHNSQIYLSIKKGIEHFNFWSFSRANIIQGSIYFAIRLSMDAKWLNDRDQFLYPNDGWETDTEFQNNCLAIALFHGQNRITSIDSTNHWIPFAEQEVNAKEKFESNFMTQFIKGKVKQETASTFFASQEERTTPLVFSAEAHEVFNAGRELWKYYHKQPDCNVNASLYDIREHFKGRNESGKMNNKSDNETYMSLISNLRSKLKLLPSVPILVRQKIQEN